jgi:hypothetical protein
MIYLSILYSGNYTCGVFRDAPEAIEWANGPGRFHPAVLWHSLNYPAGTPLRFNGYATDSNPNDPSECWTVPAHGPRESK